VPEAHVATIPALSCRVSRAISSRAQPRRQTSDRRLVSGPSTSRAADDFTESVGIEQAMGFSSAHLSMGALWNSRPGRRLGRALRHRVGRRPGGRDSSGLRFSVLSDRARLAPRQ
jgi:hypothetical protein